MVSGEWRRPPCPAWGVPATCPTPSPRPSCSWTPRRPKPTCPSLSFPGPPPAGAAAGQTKRRRSAGQPTGVGTARAPTLVPQGPRPGSSRSQVRLGLGRGQVRTRRGQLGGSGPGRRGRGQGLLGREKGLGDGRGGGRAGQRSESLRTGPASQRPLGAQTVLTCTRRGGSRMVRCPGIQRRGVEPAGPRNRSRSARTADSPEDKHCSPEPPWGPRAYALVVSLGCLQRLRRDQTHLCSRPLLPHTTANTTSSQAAPKALPARRCPCGLGRHRWLFDLLRLNVGRG